METTSPIDIYLPLGQQIPDLPVDLQGITFSQLTFRLDKETLLTQLLTAIPLGKLPENIYFYVARDYPLLITQIYGPRESGIYLADRSQGNNAPQAQPPYPMAEQSSQESQALNNVFGAAAQGMRQIRPIPGPIQMYTPQYPYQQAPYQVPIIDQPRDPKLMLQPLLLNIRAPAMPINPLAGSPSTSNINFSQVEPRYPLPNGRQTVKEIITEDWIYRNRKGWPLVPLSDFDYYRNSFATTNPNGDDLLMTPSYRHQWSMHNNGNESYKEYLSKVSKVINNFHSYFYGKFPEIKPLLEKYKGKLAVCGGAVTRTLVNRVDSITDVDLFFYNTSKEEAFAILLDCAATLIANYTDGKAIIERKLYVTNVILESENRSPRIYQFIHRIYPTLDSIIGGFDLGPAMVCFDGERVYGTPLGVYSIAKRCVIVDTTRRSLSFEHRIVKYSKLMKFAVIFPGITIAKANEIQDIPVDLYPAGHKVYLLMKKLGLYFRGEDIEHYSDIFGTTNHGGDIYLDKLHVYDNNVKMKKRDIGEFETTPEDILKKYTDYGADEDYRWKYKTISNGTVLRTNNIEAVSVFVSFKQSRNYQESNYRREKPIHRKHRNATYQDVVEAFLTIIAYPQLSFDETYKGRAFAYIAKKQNRIETGRGVVNRIATEIRLFAEMAPKMRNLQMSIKPEKIQETQGMITLQVEPNSEKYQKQVMDEMTVIVDLLNDRMAANIIKAKENLRGMKWIDQDPQRQWTSSINPVVKKPEDFYGKYYVSLGLGIPCNVETTIRLMRKFRPGSSFAKLPNDVFKLILMYILRAYTYNSETKKEEIKFIGKEQPIMGIQTIIQPTIQKPSTLLNYFNTLALENGGDLRPKGNIEKRYQEEAVTGPFGIRTHGFYQNQAIQEIMNRLPMPLQNPFPSQQIMQQGAPVQFSQNPFSSDDDSDSDEEELQPTIIPGMFPQMPPGFNPNNTLPLMSPNLPLNTPMNIISDVPMPVSMQELPLDLLHIGENRYLDEKTGIAYIKWPNGWTTYGHLAK